MFRSLKVSASWLKKVKQALSRYDFSSQKALAEELNILPRKISDFFNGKLVEYDVFVAICARLELDWQKVAKVSTEISKSEIPKSEKSESVKTSDSANFSQNLNPENPSPQFSGGIPKLASSLFKTFDSENQVAQKKFLNTAISDVSSSFEKLPEKLPEESPEKIQSAVLPGFAEAPLDRFLIQEKLTENHDEFLTEEQTEDLPKAKELPKDIATENKNAEGVIKELLGLSPNLAESAINPITISQIQELLGIVADIKKTEKANLSAVLPKLELSEPDLNSIFELPDLELADPELADLELPVVAAEINPIVNPPQNVSSVVNPPNLSLSNQALSNQALSADDLELSLSACRECCKTQDWETAAAVVGDINLKYVRKTADLSAILDLCNQLLPPKWLSGEQKIADHLHHWQILYNAGWGAFYLEKYTAAANYFEAALKFAQNLEANYKPKIQALNGLAVVCQALSQYQSAIKFCQQVQTLAKESPDLALQLPALSNLGNIYYSLRQYRTAIAYYQEFLQLSRAQAEADNELEFAAIGNLGNAYYNLGETQMAVGYQQKYLEIARQIGNSEKEAGSLVALGFTYAALGLFQTAIEHYELAREIVDKFAYLQPKISLFSGLGLSYLSLKNYSTAVVCFHKSLEAARQVGERSAEVKALYNLRRANFFNISNQAVLTVK